MEFQNRVGAGWIATGAVLAGVCVILGSIGAHGLASMIQAMDDLPKRLANWDTGVRYQMVHSLGLILVGVLATLYGPSRLLSTAGWLFLVGILLFSVGLYVWVFTDSGPVVAVVPIGGLAFILGWVCIATRALLVMRSK